MSLFSAYFCKHTRPASAPSAASAPAARRVVRPECVPPTATEWTLSDGRKAWNWCEMEQYDAPGGDMPEFFAHLMMADGGVLISGATGSGKSVVLNGLVTSILRHFNPVSANHGEMCELYLIDPKMVELNAYTVAPHVSGYASDHGEICELLDEIDRRMMARYAEMQERGIKKWDGARIIVVVDEIGDLMTTHKQFVLPRITHLLNLCRAAGITIFLSSQSPSRATIPAAAQINATVKVALRCDTAIESKQVVGIAGAETLPRHGKALVKAPWLDGIKTVSVPYVDEREQAEVLQAVTEELARCNRRVTA